MSLCLRLEISLISMFFEVKIAALGLPSLIVGRILKLFGILDNRFLSSAGSVTMHIKVSTFLTCRDSSSCALLDLSLIHI